MEDDLYCYESCVGYDIYVSIGTVEYYGEVYFEGECIEWSIKSATGEDCLDKCKQWCLEQEEN
jgi:hypothetical protein